MILIVAFGVTNTTKTDILTINHTTLLPALLPYINLTLVIVLIVITREITLTRLDPIKIHITLLLNHNRSRSHSYSKPEFQPAVNHIEPTFSSDTPFEINMNYPTIANAITPSPWFFNLCIS